LEGSSLSSNTSYQTARNIASLALQKKARNVCIISLENLSSVTDYFVICHGDVDVQVKAITDHIQSSMKEKGIRVWHREGYDYLNWVLLDYVDVVVHVFQKDARTFYRIEKLWGDAKQEIVTETDE